MKSLFEFTEEEIQGLKKKWLILFVSSILAYLFLVLLFVFVERRNNAVYYLVSTYFLTAAEACFILYCLLYKLKRIKRYGKLLYARKNVLNDTYTYVKEKDYVIQDGLPFRTLVFVDEKQGQEYTFYLIASFTDRLCSNKRYSIGHVGAMVYTLGGQDEE